MDDLVAWLRAQIDEDERVAQAAQQRETVSRRMVGGRMVDVPNQPLPEWRRSVWPPARVLREVETKRRHIGQYEAAVDLRDRAIAAYKQTGSQADTAQVITYSAKVQALWFVLLDDAAVFVDRPGYRETWTPSVDG